MSDYLVIDLDGCSTDHEWRWNKVDHSEMDKEKRFADYNAHCGADKPMNMALIEQLLKPANTYPLIVTARPDIVRKETRDWLYKYFPVSLSINSLLMRPRGNYDSSPKLKVDLINQWLKDNHNIHPKISICLDDRQDILDAYTEQGWQTMLVSYQTPINDLSEPKSQLDRIEDLLIQSSNRITAVEDFLLI